MLQKQVPALNKGSKFLLGCQVLCRGGILRHSFLPTLSLATGATSRFPRRHTLHPSFPQLPPAHYQPLGSRSSSDPVLREVLIAVGAAEHPCPRRWPVFSEGHSRGPSAQGAAPRQLALLSCCCPRRQPCSGAARQRSH